MAVENALGLDQQVSCSGLCISFSPDLTCLVAQLLSSAFSFPFPRMARAAGRQYLGALEGVDACGEC